MGYYTDQTCAPTKLLTSTIADELKIATQGKGIVYAIAPFCDAAIFAAGHAGNGAFWINPTTGKWSGTTYYGEFRGGQANTMTGRRLISVLRV